MTQVDYYCMYFLNGKHWWFQTRAPLHVSPGNLAPLKLPMMAEPTYHLLAMFNQHAQPY